MFNILQYGPTSLNFGRICINTTADLTITFTNSSSPTTAQNVTLTVASPYSIVGHGTSFTFSLAGNGSAQVVTFRYSPTVASAGDPSNINVSTDAASPPSPFPIAVTGSAYSNTYALPSISNNAGGVMKVNLIVDTSLPELTIPTGVKITKIGALQELIDVEPGIVDVQNLDLEVAEDYTTYAMGFWYKVIQGYPTVNVQFEMILTENGVDSFFFWGKVYREQIKWGEPYVTNTAVVRNCKMKIVSLIHSTQDVVVTKALTEMDNHFVSGIISLQDIIASIVYVCFGGSYDTTAAQFRNDDIQFQDPTFLSWTGASGIDLNRTWVAKSLIDLTSSQNNVWWGLQFSSCYDLLRAICLSFGWVGRYYFGQADGTYKGDGSDIHRLEFLTRGQSFANFVTPEKGITESTLYSDTVIKNQNIRVSDIQQASDFYNNGGARYDYTVGNAYAIDGAEVVAQAPSVTSLGDTFPVNTAPNFAKFDLDVNAQFILRTTYGGGSLTDNLHRAVRLSGYVATARFWDYKAGAWVTDTNYVNVLMKYYNRRFSPGRKMYQRKYGSMKFTLSGVTSQANLKPMVRIQINDFIATQNYYATEVVKDFQGGSSTVTWVQE